MTHMHLLKQLICLILMIAALTSTAAAQSVRLTPYRAPSALYLNADRFYDYNIYEHNRFELGLTWVTPSENAAQPPKVFLGQWRTSAALAYGTMDRELKYSASIQLRPAQHSNILLGISAFSGLDAAASRRLDAIQMTATDRNSHYLWSRFVRAKGFAATFTADNRKSLLFALSLRQTWEDCRFDSQHLFYPALEPDEQQPTHPFTELQARLAWTKSATLYIRAGRTTNENDNENENCCYFTALAQYDKALDRAPGLSLFVQAGYATCGTPYSRLFDLGGTAGTPYFFRYTFLTIPPHSLVANSYAMIFANYTCPVPLWDLGWSKPQPFVQAGAMYGRSFGPAPHFDGCLTAPDSGLAEASAGIDRLLRWGLLDLGVAAAFQLGPTAASYSADPQHRAAFAAKAILDL